MHSFCIVSSNYTGWLFAWKGTPSAVKKYLGNREVIGTVSADSEEAALSAWRSRLT
jgi:hypothetical protein